MRYHPQLAAYIVTLQGAAQTLPELKCMRGHHRLVADDYFVECFTFRETRLQGCRLLGQGRDADQMRRMGAGEPGCRIQYPLARLARVEQNRDVFQQGAHKRAPLCPAQRRDGEPSSQPELE